MSRKTSLELGSPGPVNTSADIEASSVAGSPRPFFPDHDSDQEDLAGVPSEEDEDDAQIFSFRRPDTAAEASTSGPSCPLEGIMGQEEEISSDGNSNSRKVDTGAAQDAKFYFQPSRMDSTSNKDDIVSVGTRVVPSIAYASDKTSVFAQSIISRSERSMAGTRFHQNQNRSAYMPGKYDHRPHVSSNDAANNQVRLRRRPRLPLRRNSSPDRVQDELPDCVEMASVRRSNEVQDRPNSPCDWDLSEHGGPPTIPDGVTTRGDGAGGHFVTSTQARQGTPVASDAFGEEAEEEDSAYAEVRSSVSNIDDPNMPVLTFRSILIGIVLCLGMTSINNYSTYRDPGVFIQAVVSQVVAYPAGKFLAWIMPLEPLTLPKKFGAWQIDLNPGPFNIKEHAVILIIVFASSPSMWTIQLSMISEIELGQVLPKRFAPLMTLSYRLGGIGLGCFLHKLLVWPASMLYPYQLVTIASLNAFHAEDQGDGTTSRFKMLMGTFLVAVIYQFFPGFILTSLSYLTWICWILPKNVIVNQLVGGFSGVGMGSLSLDWNQVSGAGNPAMMPWEAMANIISGFFFSAWIMAPILYYSNACLSAYLPLNTGQQFDRFGDPYDFDRVLKADKSLDVQAYNSYSPLYFSTTSVLTQSAQLAMLTGSFTQMCLKHGSFIWRTIRYGKAEDEDIHNKLMNQYPPVSPWWGLVAFLISFIVVVVTVVTQDVTYPVWGIFLATGVALVWVIPGAFLSATVAANLRFSSMTQFIPGFLMKESASQNLFFKVIAAGYFDGVVQSLALFKIGHYTKIPPRINVLVQIIATVAATLTGWGLQMALVSRYPDLCRPNQPNNLTCPSMKSLLRTGIVWGSIGPARLYTEGSTLWPTLFSLLVGLVSPIIAWWLGRLFPSTPLKHINTTLFFLGAAFLPDGPALGVIMFSILGFIIQYWLRKFRFLWWSRYAFVMVIALDLATAVTSTLIILLFNMNNVKFEWSGNTIYKKTADWHQAPYKQSPPHGFA